MSIAIELVPWLIPMGVLILISAFFSGSEAALFSLTPQQRRRLGTGNTAQQTAERLLARPEQLLTTVLFWNLVVNMTYFAILSIAGLQLQQQGESAAAGVFTAVALITIILLSEMLPKSVAVIQAPLVASIVAVPLTASLRLLAPLLPALTRSRILVQRVVWPGFKPEPYLEVADLERAVELSTHDAALLEQERTVLQNIVSLSQVRVDEMMRPRTQVKIFKPPVSIESLRGQIPPSGYILLSETDNEEIAAAVPLTRMTNFSDLQLERYAEDVVFVPWCSTVGQALDHLRSVDRHVLVVVNEHGETIGVLTIDDILHTTFTAGAGRSERLLQQTPVTSVDAHTWHALGITTIRRLSREIGYELPSTKSVTLAGIIQQQLQRIPKKGDRCDWGSLELEVLRTDEEGPMLVAVRRIAGGDSHA